MSNYPGLEANLVDLVVHAENRYEDAAICDAIRQYILQVGTIPASVWGKMPWVGKWQADWAVGRDYRITEATNARDGIASTAAGLHQVAVDYHGSDIAISMDFEGKMDASSAALAPYLRALQVTPPNLATPGGHVAPPSYYGGPPVNPQHNLDTPEGQRLDRIGRSDSLDMPEITAPGTVTPRMRDREYFGDTPGRMELWKFVNEHYQVLTQAEELVRQYGPGLAKYPSSDFIDEALDAYPRVIIERADMISVAAQNYAEMQGEYLTQLTNLRSSWASPTGSAAYFTAGTSIITFLKQLQTQAQWLSDEGKKAGKAVDDLMMAYAKAGYEKISIVIKQVQDLLDELKSFSPDPTKPAQALADMLTAMATIMLDQWNAANDAAKSMLNVAEVAASGAPDAGTASHGATPFPNAQGGDSWKNTPWQPHAATTQPALPVG
ncbi:hypothetical protein [Micromonospora sp. DT31]|uniref:hypothetical protein n=1 Tax=Micromonospora sp. DT31 TaxID=3393434 RepID=UPI003CECC771